jgi:hypothetical protein
MTTEIDVYRSAKLLIEKHGDAASIHAATRADAIHMAGDLDGYTVWKRIIRAIDILHSRPEPQTRWH